MGKRTFGAEFAFAVQFPISAHFCFEFLLEVALRCHDCPRLHGFDLVAGRYLVVDLAVVELMRVGHLPRIVHRV